MPPQATNPACSSQYSTAPSTYRRSTDSHTASRRVEPCGSLTLEVGHDRSLKRSEEPRRRRSELGGSSECTAICHVAELPLARSAGGRQCPVRIEIPRASRRRDGAAGATWLAGGLAGYSIRLELHIGIWLTVRARLTLLERRWEPIRCGLVRP